MKINQIPSFGRIIKIYSDSQISNKNKKVDNSTFEICKILNSEPTNKYSKKQAQSIREFFKSVLGDYNGHNGILIRKTNLCDTYLFSGKDALKVKNIEKHEKYMGERKANNLIQNVFNRAFDPEYSINFKTGFITKSGFNIFNEITYGRTKVTSGTIVDGIMQKYEPGKEKTISSIEYEQQSIQI